MAEPPVGDEREGLPKETVAHHDIWAYIEKLEARVEQLTQERDNLSNLYWDCAISFARLRDFNEATRAAWATIEETPNGD